MLQNDLGENVFTYMLQYSTRMFGGYRDSLVTWCIRES
jgi:hypothetical protein